MYARVIKISSHSGYMCNLSLTPKLLEINHSCISPRMNCLEYTYLRSVIFESTQERTASALWAIAGDDLDEQRTIAGLMGVSLLVDFLKVRQDFEQLSFIGSECLGVLAHGPRNKQTAIANANGVGKVCGFVASFSECVCIVLYTSSASFFFFF